MTSPKQVLKAVGPKLVPFFKTVAIYFVLFIPSDQPSVFAAIIKCLPVLSLIAFVLLHGMSFGDEYAYSRRILLGLIFSVIADALLVWEELFVHGLAGFLVALLCYISAFGFTPFNVYAASVITVLLAGGMSLLVPCVSGVMSIAVPMYSLILMIMVWRAVARVQLFEELWTWTKLCSCAGGICFAISDTAIGFNAFYSKIPYSQVIIMTTYYAAQLGISLSVVDSKASYLDSQRFNNIENNKNKDFTCQEITQLSRSAPNSRSHSPTLSSSFENLNSDLSISDTYLQETTAILKDREPLSSLLRCHNLKLEGQL